MLEKTWHDKLVLSLEATKNTPESRFVQLATTDNKGVPQNRTVVFREFGENNALIIFSDKRSAKFSEIKANPWVAICWYFADLREQYRLLGQASEINDKRMIVNAWQSLSEKSKAQYLWGEPGRQKLREAHLPTNTKDYIQSPPEHFWVISIDVSEVDYLTLLGEPQTRIRYRRKNTTWTEEYLIP